MTENKTASSRQTTSTDQFEKMAEELLRRRYVSRADERQKSLGLSYIEAETSDLIQHVAAFARVAAEASALSMREQAVREIQRIAKVRREKAGSMTDEAVLNYAAECVRALPLIEPKG